MLHVHYHLYLKDYPSNYPTFHNELIILEQITELDYYHVFILFHGSIPDADVLVLCVQNVLFIHVPNSLYFSQYIFHVIH